MLIVNKDDINVLCAHWIVKEKKDNKKTILGSGKSGLGILGLG